MRKSLKLSFLHFIPIILLFTAYAISVYMGFQSLVFSAVTFIFLGLFSFAINEMLWTIFSLAILIFIPAEVNIIFTKISYINPTGEINLHVLTYFVIGGFVWWFFSNYKKKILEIKFLNNQAIIFFIMIIVELLIELLNIREGGGISNQIVDVYIGPILFYFILTTILDSNKRNQNTLTFFLILITLISFCGIIEFISKNNLYLDKFLSSQSVSWYNAYLKSELLGESYRIKTTLGHPLTNSAYFLTAFIFVIYSFDDSNKSKILTMIISIILFIAIILTFSRSAFILAFIGMIWFLIRNQRRVKVSRLIIFSMFLIILYIILEPLITILVGRDLLFKDSSAAVRFNTITAFIKNLSSISIFGYGPKNMEGAINSLFNSSVGSFSLEIGYVIMILQFGFLFFLLYLVGILQPLREKAKRISIEDKFKFTSITTALVLLIIDFGASNTIGVRSTINYLFFLLLAILSSKLIAVEKDEYRQMI